MIKSAMIAANATPQEITIMAIFRGDVFLLGPISRVGALEGLGASEDAFGGFGLGSEDLHTKSRGFPHRSLLPD